MSGMGIYGLSGSGIDVDSMVRMGMMTRQNEYDKMYKKEVRNEWTKEAYANMYSDLNTFNSVTMSTYKMSATSNPQTVSSSDTSVATATANADAAQMTHTLTVNSMASNAYLLTGSEGITRGDGSSTSKSMYLADILGEGVLNSGESITMEVSDGENSATLTITYDQVYSNQQTLNDLASAFRKLKSSDDKSLNLSASYDATNDAFTLYNKNGGSTNTISIKPTSAAAEKLLDNLNLHSVNSGTMSDDAVDFTNGTQTVAATGTDASVTIDGRTYTNLSSNKVTVSNVTYSF